MALNSAQKKCLPELSLPCELGCLKCRNISAGKVNVEFRYMQADMYNLVPASGEVNGLRSNYSFAMLQGEERRFGSSYMEIRDRKAELSADVRG